MAPRRDCCTAQIERQGRACGSIKGMSDCRGRSMAYSKRGTCLIRRSLVSPMWLLLAAPVMVLALGAGCGGGASNTAHVQGQVTIEGQPLPADAIGSITFQPTAPGQGPTAGAPLEDGRYDSPQTPLGPLRAYITVQQPTGRTIDNARGAPAPEYKNIVSDQYGAGIEVEVAGDRDDLNFDLKGS